MTVQEQREKRRQWRNNSKTYPKTPLKNKVINMAALGMTPTRIASSTKLSGSLIKSILTAPEAQEILEQSKLRIQAMTSSALDVYQRRLDKSDDVALAREVLIANGILPHESRLLQPDAVFAPQFAFMPQHNNTIVNPSSAREITPLMQAVVQHVEENARQFDVPLVEASVTKGSTETEEDG